MAMHYPVCSFVPFSATILAEAVIMIMDYDAQVGSRIRTARELMGLSREAFAELCDVSDSFLAGVELGKTSPTVRMLNKICLASKLSADYIVTGTTPDDTDDKQYIAFFAVIKTIEPERLQCCTEVFTSLIKEFTKHPIANDSK